MAWKCNAGGTAGDIDPVPENDGSKILRGGIFAVTVTFLITLKASIIPQI